MAVSTADLYDQYGTGMASVSLQFRDFGGLPSFSGAARTIQCAADNGLVKATLATPGHGSVLVVDGGGSLQSALMGDMIAQSAVDNGWAGVIINGAIRDSVVIATLPLGVKALGTNPAKSSKAGVGRVDVPIHLGHVTVHAGAMVYADADGILIAASHM